MANYNAQTRKHLADEVYKNYSASDIPAGTAVLQDGTYDDGIVVPTAGGGVAKTIGVTVENIPAGGRGRVATYGIAPATAHGAVDAGTAVQVSDTALHLGQVKTCGAATTQLGVAVNTAADGEPVRVRIFVAKNA